MPKILYFGLEVDSGGVRVYYHGDVDEKGGRSFQDTELCYAKDLVTAMTIISAQIQAEGL